MDNVYCYPGTDTLKNKLNIHEKDRLSEVEIRLTAIRLYQLQESPIQGKFDFAHLCNIHYHIFQDLYPWAGSVRTVNIAKGSMFCLVQHIRSYAQTIFPAYHEDCMRMKDDLERFIPVFTEYYANMNALHPFREGNGRVQREFARGVCATCGYALDLRHTDHRKMLAGSIASFDKGDNTGLEAIFQKCIRPLSSNL